MEKIEYAAKGAGISNNLVRRSVRKINLSDWLIKPTAVFFGDHVHHHVHFGLAKKQISHSPQPLLLVKIDHFLRRQEHRRELKGEAGSSTGFSDTDATCQNRPTRQTGGSKNEHYRDRLTEDEQFFTGQSEQSHTRWTYGWRRSFLLGYWIRMHGFSHLPPG